MPTIQNGSMAWGPSKVELWSPYSIAPLINAFAQANRQKPGEKEAWGTVSDNGGGDWTKVYVNACEKALISKLYPNIQTKDDYWTDEAQPTFDDSKMYAKFCVSTQNLDRDGDIVVSQGCDLRDYSRYSPWFLAHMESCPFPIGSAKETPNTPPDIQIGEESIHAGCFFNRVTREAEITYELLKLGHLRACSIGFQADPNAVDFLTGKDVQKRYGRNKVRRINHWWLCEISVCGLGANQDALLEYAGKTKIPESMKSLFGNYEPKLFTTKLADAFGHEHSEANGQFTAGGGEASKPEGHVAAMTSASGVAREWAGKIAASGVKAPAAAIKGASKAIKWVNKRIENRYGKGVARAVNIATLLSLPIPVPGASVALSAPIVAFAEIHRQFFSKEFVDFMRKKKDIDDKKFRELVEFMLKRMLGVKIKEEVDFEKAFSQKDDD